MHRICCNMGVNLVHGILLNPLWDAPIVRLNQIGMSVNGPVAKI